MCLPPRKISKQTVEENNGVLDFFKFPHTLYSLLYIKMNAQEDKEQPSMMSLLSWLSEVTNQRSSIASVKELKSCSVLLVLCENLLSKEQDLTKRTKKTNDDDDDDMMMIIIIIKARRIRCCSTSPWTS